MSRKNSATYSLNNFISQFSNGGGDDNDDDSTYNINRNSNYRKNNNSKYNNKKNKYNKYDNKKDKYKDNKYGRYKYKKASFRYKEKDDNNNDGNQLNKKDSEDITTNNKSFIKTNVNPTLQRFIQSSDNINGDNDYDYHNNNNNRVTAHDSIIMRGLGGVNAETICYSSFNTNKTVSFSYFGDVNLECREGSLNKPFPTTKCVTPEALINSLGSTNQRLFDIQRGKYSRIKSYIPGILVPKILWNKNLDYIKKDFYALIKKLLDNEIPNNSVGLTRRQVIAWITKRWKGENAIFPQSATDVLECMDGCLIKFEGRDWKECDPISSHTVISCPSDGFMCVKPNVSTIGTYMEEKVLWLLGKDCRITVDSRNLITGMLQEHKQDPKYVYYVHPYQNFGHIHVHRMLKKEWIIGDDCLHPNDLKQIGQLVHDSQNMTKTSGYAFDIGYPLDIYNMTVVALSIAVYLWGVTINGAEDLFGVNCSPYIVGEMLRKFRELPLCETLLSGLAEGLVYVPNGKKPIEGLHVISGLFNYIEIDVDDNLRSGLVGTRSSLTFNMLKEVSKIKKISKFSQYNDDVIYNKKLVSGIDDCFHSCATIQSGMATVGKAVDQDKYRRCNTLVENRGDRKANHLLSIFDNYVSKLEYDKKVVEIGCGAGGFMRQWLNAGYEVLGITKFDADESARAQDMAKYITYTDITSSTHIPQNGLVVSDLATGRGIGSFAHTVSLLKDVYKNLSVDVIFMFKWKGVAEYIDELVKIVNTMDNLCMVKAAGSRIGNSEVYFIGVKSDNKYNYKNSILTEWYTLVSLMNDWNKMKELPPREYFQIYSSPASIDELSRTWANQPIVVRVDDPNEAVSEWMTVGDVIVYKDDKGYFLQCTSPPGRWEMVRAGLCYTGPKLDVDFRGLSTVNVKFYDNRVAKNLIIDDHNYVATRFKLDLVGQPWVMDVGGGSSNFYHSWIDDVYVIDPQYNGPDTKGYQGKFSDFLNSMTTPNNNVPIIISTQSTIAWKDIDISKVRMMFPRAEIFVQLFYDYPDECTITSNGCFCEPGRTEIDWVCDVKKAKGIVPMHTKSDSIAYLQHKGVFSFDTKVADKTPWDMYNITKCDGILPQKKNDPLGSLKPHQPLINAQLGIVNKGQTQKKKDTIQNDNDEDEDWGSAGSNLPSEPNVIFIGTSQTTNNNIGDDITKNTNDNNDDDLKGDDSCDDDDDDIDNDTTEVQKYLEGKEQFKINITCSNDIVDDEESDEENIDLGSPIKINTTTKSEKIEVNTTTKSEGIDPDQDAKDDLFGRLKQEYKDKLKKKNYETAAWTAELETKYSNKVKEQSDRLDNELKKQKEEFNKQLLEMQKQKNDDIQSLALAFESRYKQERLELQKQVNDYKTLLVEERTINQTLLNSMAQMQYKIDVLFKQRNEKEPAPVVEKKEEIVAPVEQKKIEVAVEPKKAIITEPKKMVDKKVTKKTDAPKKVINNKTKNIVKTVTPKVITHNNWTPKVSNVNYLNTNKTTNVSHSNYTPKLNFGKKVEPKVQPVTKHNIVPKKMYQ